MRSIALGVFALVALSPRTLTANPAAQDVERGKQAARENQLLPGHETFYWKAVQEASPFIDPLLDECALQDCFGAGMSNTYVARVQADGTLGEVFVEPSNRFTACLAAGLKARVRLPTPPPSDGYWITWSASGIMRTPEGCRDELTPPAWHTVKWWLFLAAEAFPEGAYRVRALLLALSVLPFVLALAGWRLLRPDDRERELLGTLALGAGLVLLAAASAFLIGHLGNETKYDNWENVLTTVLFAFPFLACLPLAIRGLRRPRVPRGSRLAPATAGRMRRAIGSLLLLAGLLPATAMMWFTAHENVHRLCPTCVRPYKFR